MRPAVFQAMRPLVNHIKHGVVAKIQTGEIRGPLAEAISAGIMDNPVIFASHGHRAASIQNGSLPIDVAFLGASSCDPLGNANGFCCEGSSSSEFGSMGYGMVDARYAKKVIVLTDRIVDYPNMPFAIPQYHVDYVVKIDEIGDKQGIISGSIRLTRNPKELLIAKYAAEVIAASGYFKDGFSLQTGAGGASLAATAFLREKMIRKGIKASYALGGITGNCQPHDSFDKKDMTCNLDLAQWNALNNPTTQRLTPFTIVLYRCGR